MPTTKYLSQYNDATGRNESLKGTSSGQVATWSASAQEWVPAPGGTTGGGGQVFFFNFGNTDVTPTGSPLPQSTTSTPSTSPSLLGDVFNPVSTNALSADLLPINTDVLIAGFLTAASSPNILSIPAGLWNFNFWAKANAGNTSQIFVTIKIYIANAAGTQYGDASGETNQIPLATVTPVGLTGGASLLQYNGSASVPATALALTDRLYIEFYAQKNTALPRTIQMYFSTAQPTHVQTSIPTLVNLATGVTGILPLANGGTGAAITASNGQVAYSDANSLELTTGGSAGQFLQFGTPPTWATPTVTQAYDLRGKFVGNPASGIVIDTFVADRAFTISATNTLHKFWADEKTAGAAVVITVQRTRAGVTSTIFTATSASTDTALNGYYPMAISTPISNNDIQVNDLIDVVMGTTQAAFSTPVWTVYGTL